ncbi:uncharacterized protein Z518_09222 [Rhinocladiella mackenziei CBS 650.93]|uniref:Uncharacterized protein n=1 Tax=Rhinocladiella mackenziei CBS 650.93 TaxID=1442369 RepID=A0A0D2IE31_9EURO|nr:uncharacterized protein Z518_09222 [Rhinocladiella mackenziei CBS 650.93]KIX01496.1 hypothetical protein Z518_09222 [Rhinocladiella mackenziei CBS 650.93]
MVLREGDDLDLTLDVAAGELRSVGDETFAHFAGSDKNVNVTCIHQIHGFLDGPSQNPATLLVFRFDIGTRVKGRRFDFFSPSFKVRKNAISTPGHGVWVEDLYEPDWVYMSEVTSKKTKKSSIQPSLNVSPPAPFDIVSGGLTWTAEDSDEWTETYRYTLQATPTADTLSGRPTKKDGVYWTAEVEDERAKKSSGISKFQVAMLIGREDQGDFELVINIKEGDIDLWDRIKEVWKTVRGRESRERIVTISPSKSRSKAVPIDIHPDYLRRLEENGHQIMKDLTFVGGPQFLQPASLAKIN